jgi:CHAD domain-containing protein
MMDSPATALSLDAAPADDGAAPRPAPSRSRTPLAPSEPMIVLGYQCLQRNFEQLVAHRPRDKAPPGVDDVHQMRIATRRLRVALRLFGHMLPVERPDRLGRELRWFARALGTVRDLDVHAASLRRYLRGLDERSAQELNAYELALRRERLAARAELIDVFDTERYARLMSAFEALVGTGLPPGALRRWHSFTIADGAKCLKKSRKRVRKLGRRLRAAASSTDLHRLRIRAKRLRYELEFFRAAYPDLDAAIKVTRSLQDVLGAHQDAAAEARRLASYQRAQRRLGRPEAATPALEAWRKAQRRRGADAREAFSAEWPALDTELEHAPLGG